MLAIKREQACKGLCVFQIPYRQMGRVVVKFYARKYIPEFKDTWPDYIQFRAYLRRTYGVSIIARSKRIPAFWTETDEIFAEYKARPSTFTQREKEVIQWLIKAEAKCVIFHEELRETPLTPIIAEVLWDMRGEVSNYIKGRWNYTIPERHKIDILRPFQHVRTTEERLRLMFIDCFQPDKLRKSDYTGEWTEIYEYAARAYNYGLKVFAEKSSPRYRLTKRGQARLQQRMENFYDNNK